MSDLAANLPIKLDKQAHSNGVAMILDFDHFWTAPSTNSPFSIDTANQKLAELHEGARAAFWRATTDYGRDILWA